MSPERIRNESYSYPADIWSLGLALFECGTGEFPYTANEGPVNLMLQVLSFFMFFGSFYLGKFQNHPSFNYNIILVFFVKEISQTSMSFY